MLTQISSNFAKIERILVPMAKGNSSKIAFNIATEFAKKMQSEVTALTVKDMIREVTWSDKVAVVMSAYKESRDMGIEVIPKIQSARNIKEGIVRESNSKNYDLVLMSSRGRTGVSGSVYGSIGDYILKNSKNTTAVIATKGSKHPYRNIFIPMSERLNSRKSVYLGAVLSKVLDAKFILCDARSFDKKRIHGFTTIMNAEIWKELNLDFELRELNGADLRSAVISSVDDGVTGLLVLGIRPDQYSNVRINMEIKRISRDSKVDVLLIKR